MITKRTYSSMVRIIFVYTRTGKLVGCRASWTGGNR